MVSSLNLHFLSAKYSLLTSVQEKSTELEPRKIILKHISKCKWSQVSRLIGNETEKILKDQGNVKV